MGGSKGLAKETSLLFLVKIAGAIFAFVLQVVINRLIGTSFYGQLSTYLAVAAVAINLMNAGTNTGIVKKTATATDLKGEKKSIIFSITTLLTITAILLFGVIIFNKKAAGLVDNNKSILLFILLYSFLFAVSNIYTGYFQGKKRTLYGNFIDIICYNVLLILGIFIVSFFSKTIYSLLAVYVSVTGLLLLIKMVSVHKPLQLIRIDGTLRELYKENINYSIMCIPFCLSTMCISVQAMILKVILNSNMGSFDVGVFRILETYVSCMALFVTPFVTLWPYMAEAYKNSKLNDLKNTYSMSVSIIALLVIPTTVSMLVCTKEVYAIFSLDYLNIKGAFVALALMIIAGAIDAIIGPAGALLNMTRFGNINFLITAGSTLLSIVLSMVIIPSYGLLGATIAIAFSRIITNIANALVNWKLLHIWPYELKLFLFLAISVPMYFIGVVVYSRLPDSLILRIFIIAFIEVFISVVVFLLIYKGKIGEYKAKLSKKNNKSK